MGSKSTYLFKTRATLFALLTTVPFALGNAQSFQDYDGDYPASVKTYSHLRVTMRDGVEL